MLGLAANEATAAASASIVAHRALLYRYLTTVSQGGNADIDTPASTGADP